MRLIGWQGFGYQLLSLLDSDGMLSITRSLSYIGWIVGIDSKSLELKQCHVYISSQIEMFWVLLRYTPTIFITVWFFICRTEARKIIRY